MNRRVVSGVLTGVAALGLVGLQTVPAAAATTVSARTTDGAPIGGTGIFWGNTTLANNPAMRTRESLGACDKQGNDRKIVYAEAQWKVRGQWQYFSVHDTDGSGNGCHEAWLPNIAEGTKVYIKACLKTTVNHRQEYCGKATGIA
ncbi:hypothetical protein ACFVT5_30675 [Streptomyces sp. NPDC058001]|uniref:hypothetical protein n=1 Tax=Streptomyces sp. NPDC058001 TaxID=3346300 RepID=UPI0036ED65AD